MVDLRRTMRVRRPETPGGRAAWPARGAATRRGPLRRERCRPAGDLAGEVVDHVRVGATRAAGEVEGVIRVVDDVEPRARAERREEGTEQVERGELVARALEEQHRDADAREVLAALRSGFLRRVEGE